MVKIVSLVISQGTRFEPDSSRQGERDSMSVKGPLSDATAFAYYFFCIGLHRLWSRLSSLSASSMRGMPLMTWSTIRYCVN